MSFAILQEKAGVFDEKTRAFDGVRDRLGRVSFYRSVVARKDALDNGYPRRCMLSYHVCDGGGASPHAACLPRADFVSVRDTG